MSRGPHPSPTGDRPRVRINMAITADGKINTATRSVPGFGSARDIDQLYRLRAGADAILCGARTVEESGAVLDHGSPRHARLRSRLGLRRPALRVLVSGRGTVSPEARIWSHPGAPVIVLAGGSLPAARRRALETLGAEVWESRERRLDLAAALRWLHQRHGVRTLLAEGGGELNAALFRAGLVDEVHVTVCPRIFGGRSAPTLAGGEGFRRVADAVPLELTGMRRAGDELFLTYRVLHDPPPGRRE